MGRVTPGLSSLPGQRHTKRGLIGIRYCIPALSRPARLIQRNKDTIVMHISYRGILALLQVTMIRPRSSFVAPSTASIGGANMLPYKDSSSWRLREHCVLIGPLQSAVGSQAKPSKTWHYSLQLSWMSVASSVYRQIRTCIATRSELHISLDRLYARVWHYPIIHLEEVSVVALSSKSGLKNFGGRCQLGDMVAVVEDGLLIC